MLPIATSLSVSALREEQEAYFSKIQHRTRAIGRNASINVVDSMEILCTFLLHRESSMCFMGWVR